MHHSNYLPGIRSTTIGALFLREAGDPHGHPVLFVHGNVSSSAFWEETMLALPAGFYALAPDLRGYGNTQPQPVDATRGVRDFSDDLFHLVTTRNLRRIHLVAHSMGGIIALQYCIDHAETVVTLTLVSPGSPYGFGGTKGVRGIPCWHDYAGSGGGIVNPEIIRLLRLRDDTLSSPFSPRSLLRTHYVKPPYISPREQVLVEAMLQTNTSDDNYSRHMVPSPNWPNVAPGTKGVNNALSPKYCTMSAFARIVPQPPVLWVRGSDDRIVSDNSMADPGMLGALGIIPGWPGTDTYPPQPMVSQTRTLLEDYRDYGGMYEAHVLPNVGHVPYLEDAQRFQAIWLDFLHRHQHQH